MNTVTTRTGRISLLKRNLVTPMTTRNQAVCQDVSHREPLATFSRDESQSQPVSTFIASKDFLCALKVFCLFWQLARCPLRPLRRSLSTSTSQGSCRSLRRRRGTSPLRVQRQAECGCQAGGRGTSVSMFGELVSGKARDLTMYMRRAAGWQETVAGAGPRTNGAGGQRGTAVVTKTIGVSLRTTNDAGTDTTALLGRRKKDAADIRAAGKNNAGGFWSHSNGSAMELVSGQSPADQQRAWGSQRKSLPSFR